MTTRKGRAGRIVGGRARWRELCADVVRRFEAGETQAEIAKVIRASQSTVSRILGAAGVEVRHGKASDRQWQRDRGILPREGGR